MSSASKSYSRQIKLIMTSLGMWAVRQTEGHQELVYIQQVLHVSKEDGASHVKLHAFRFTLQQLRARVTSNTLTVRRARFNELMDAYTPGERTSVAYFRPAQLQLPRGGTWAWKAVDLREWMRGLENGPVGDFRPLHLAQVAPTEYVYTYR